MAKAHSKTASNVVDIAKPCAARVRRNPIRHAAHAAL